jgi:hypothetical protein
MAWPEAERSVTITQLWQRFTTQVGLPILARQQSLLEMLRLGEYEGLLAIGLLLEEQSPRDQRDSYVQLHFKDMLPQNVPVIGERWIVMRPELYRDVAEQPERVTAEEIIAAVEELGNGENPVAGPALYKYVKSMHKHGIDEGSYREAVEISVKENKLGYKEGGQTATKLTVDDPETLTGEFFKATTIKTSKKDGRVIVIRGSIDPARDVAALYKKVLQPLSSQGPSSLTMKLTISAEFDEDPGSGLDAILDEAFDNDTFPTLIREDTKKD